jgi:NADPH:quinone reductase-like Zn-dependent oxidoreductase
VRAVRVHRFGDAAVPGVLSVDELPDPVPGPGQLRVRMTRRPVNPTDLHAVGGAPLFEWARTAALPAVPGGEGAGVVEAAGPGAGSGWVGRRVAVYAKLAAPAGGTWAEQVLARPDGLVAVPDAVPDATAAGLWQNPLTAVGVLDVLALPAGATLLVTGAASATGRVLVQLAAAGGIHVVATTRDPARAGALHALGADRVVHDPADVADLGVDGVADAVGGPLAAAAVRALRPGGRAVAFGNLAGAPPAGDGRTRPFYLTAWRGTVGAARVRAEVDRLVAAFATGALRPAPVAAVLPLAAVGEAVRAHHDPRRAGQVHLA